MTVNEFLSYLRSSADSRELAAELAVAYNLRYPTTGSDWARGTGGTRS